MSEFRYTSGPWRWEVNPEHRTVTLCGGKPRYDLTVLQFERWGMQGAQPLFRDVAEDGLQVMHPALRWSVPAPRREHHADWFRLIDHPDARLIENAPDMYAALESVLNSDVAMREEDEGRESETLNLVRAVLAKVRGEEATN